MHNVMKGFMKRFSAIIMALAMAIGCSASAFAAEPNDVLSAEPAVVSSAETTEASTRASIGKVIATNTTTIYGGSGSLSVNLVSGNFFADVAAQIGYAPKNSLVHCSVLTPSGQTIDLGSISGTGSKTYSEELAYAQSGTYIFYFTSAMSEPYDVIGYIFD